jgi:hypothetical protein
MHGVSWILTSALKSVSTRAHCRECVFEAWQLVVDTIVDARGQRTRVKSGMNLSGTRKMTFREPEEFGPQFDKIVIDYCRQSLTRASVATVTVAQPALLPSTVLSPPEMTPPIGLRTASPPPTGRYLWSRFPEYVSMYIAVVGLLPGIHDSS